MASAAVASSVAPNIGPIPMMSSDPTSQNRMGSISKPKSMNSAKPAVVPRGRRERPCDACRKRKSKCVVAEGLKTCATCTSQGQKCTYVEDPQPRKRRLDSGGREPELLKRRSTVSSVDGSVTPAVDPAPEKKISVSTSKGNGFHRRASQQHTSHIGPTTELEPILLDLSFIGNALPGEAYHKPDDRTTFIVDPSFKPSNSAGPDLLETIVGPHGSTLVRLYQNNVHLSFPIIEEEFFADYRNGRTSNVDAALLSAIYLTASPWLTPSTTSSIGSSLEQPRLEDAAFSLFEDSLFRPTLSTMQAGLLLMQRPNIDSKTLNAQLVGAAYELGLHLDCSCWSMAASERGLRKRLAWALYMQDKWCSLIHGRPSAIFSSNWAVRPLKDGDFDSPAGSLEKSSRGEIDRGRLSFMQMVKLTEILSIILETFYTLQAMQEVEDAGQNGRRLILDRAKPVQIRLKEWFGGLPPNLKIDATMTGKPSSTGYLHLAYFATEITLHRSIIRTFTTTTQDPYLSHICRSAAKTRLISAMDFVNRLRPEHLRAFWYFPSRVNFALIGTFGSLLLATAPCNEEVEFYHTRLAEYRWTLSVSNEMAGFLGFAVESLDSLATLLRNLPKRPSTIELEALQRETAAENSVHSISPPREEQERSLKDVSLRLGQLPALVSSVQSSASGLVSPSTSTSSGSTAYEAFVEAFPLQRR